MNRSAAAFTLATLVVLGLTAIAVAAFVVAADDEGGRPEVAGEAGFRRFVPRLQQALDERDIEFLAKRMLITEVVCTAENFGPGSLGGPQCDFEGQSYDGFVVARWRSEGNIVPAFAVLGQLTTLFDTVQPAASDDFGDGKVRVYAIDLTPDKYHAIISALIERPPDFGGSGPLRIAIGTSWTFQNGRWRLPSILNAYVLAEEFLIPCNEALDFLGGTWERYPNPGATGPGQDRCPERQQQG